MVIVTVEVAERTNSVVLSIVTVAGKIVLETSAPEIYRREVV